MKKTKKSVWPRQILLALVLGILLGSYLHYHAESRDWLISNLLTPAGDIFIHLIKNDRGPDCHFDHGGRDCRRG